MNRTQARALAKRVLDESDGYDRIFDGPTDSFDAKTPIAVITSKSIGATFDARDSWSIESGVLVSIYVRRDPGAAAAAAVEDQLDRLVDSAVRALIATGAFDIGPSDAFAENAPTRIIDGTPYRVERIPLRVADDYEEET